MRFLAATDNYFLALVGAFVQKTQAPEPPETLDWERLQWLAQQHRLDPLLLKALPPDVPATTRMALQKRARQRRIRTMVMTNAFQELHEAFTTAAIPLVPVKGIALAHTLYPSPSMRYFDDIDLLVPAIAGPQALTILAKIGYKPHPNATFPEWHHLAPHVHAKHAALVEIHLDLLRRMGPGWALSDIWQRLEPGNLDGRPVQLLAPADGLLYAILHARHNLFHRLATFIDIGYLAEAVMAAGQVELLRQLAVESSSRDLIGHSLCEVERLFGWRPLAEAGRHFALNQRQRSRLFGQIGWHSLELRQRPAHNGPLARLQEARLTDSWCAAGLYIRHLLFPPAEFVQATYGDPQKSAVRSYGRRLLKRANVAAKQFFARSG